MLLFSLSIHFRKNTILIERVLVSSSKRIKYSIPRTKFSRGGLFFIGTARKSFSRVAEERGRHGGNKEPPADELIFPDDSRGCGPAGV